MPFTEFACRASGSNLYAGTLDGGTTEVSTTPVVTYTNGGWNSGTGVFTPAAGNPVDDGVVVGQYASVYIDGASAPTGYVGKITAVTSTTFTVSLTIKSGTAPTTNATARTAVVGGAWLGPTGASGFPINFATGELATAGSRPVRINFKNDQTYSVSASIAANRTGLLFYHGYTSAYGDGGRWVIDGGSAGASYTVIAVSALKTEWLNLTLQNNGATGSASGMTIAQSANVFRGILVTGMSGHGIQHTAGNVEINECEATGNNTSNTAGLAGFAGTSGSHWTRCISHNNTGTNSSGFAVGGGMYHRCIADTNGQAGWRINTPAALISLHQCDSYNNVTDGALIIANDQGLSYFENCLFIGNGTGGTGYGVNQTTATSATVGTVLLETCGFQGNTTGKYNSNVIAENVRNEVTVGSNPYTDAPNGDFSHSLASVQSTGRGVFLQETGYTGESVGAPDLGAVQGQGGISLEPPFDLERLRRKLITLKPRLQLLLMRMRRP